MWPCLHTSHPPTPTKLDQDGDTSPLSVSSFSFLLLVCWWWTIAALKLWHETVKLSEVQHTNVIHSCSRSSRAHYSTFVWAGFCRQSLKESLWLICFARIILKNFIQLDQTRAKQTWHPINTASVDVTGKKKLASIFETSGTTGGSVSESHREESEAFLVSAAKDNEGWHLKQLFNPSRALNPH